MANYNDDTSTAQFLDGTEGDDTFLISGPSTDYEYNKVADPRGGTIMIVWRKDGRGHADVLNNIENLQFTDKMVTPDISDSGSIYTTTNNDNSDDNSDGSSFSTTYDATDDYSPESHDPDLDENIYDDAWISEEIDGYGGHDSFIINADSADYGWGPTEDGEGVVVWCPATGCFDVLFNVEEIVFNDQTLLTSDIMNMTDDGDDDSGGDDGHIDDEPPHDLDLDEYIYDDAWLSEEIDGYGGHDSFVIQDDSAYFEWALTDDGQGIVIWNEHTNCYDILYGVEEIIFDDLVFDVTEVLDTGYDHDDSDNGGSDDGSTGGGSPDDEYIMDDAWASETIDGGAGDDTFVVDGHSDNFLWDWTDDGQGIIIWNEQTNAYDTLYNVEEIWFDDISVWVDELGDDGSSDDGSTGGGSPDDEYIMDDAWASETIDGGAGDDTFVVDGHSDDFMWDWTDDGQGIMIWNLNTDATDTLYNIEELWFDDTNVMVDDLKDDNGGSDGGSTGGGSPDDEYIMDDAWASETIDGGDGDDTFVVDGHSDDFMWDWTDDGQGIMIWNLDTDATDTLYNIEELWFDDTSVMVDDLGNNSGSNSNTNSYTNNNTTNNNTENNSSDNSNNNNTNTSADEFIMDDATKSEVIDGGAGDDTFVIDGSSADFMWDVNDAGNGILIYNEATDTMDELLNIEEISFDDTTVLVEDLIG